MRYIQKRPEPASFTEWKAKANEDWQPAWNNFQMPQKNEVHQSLLDEQGHICCYCGKGINREIEGVGVDPKGIKRTISHIEHLKPRTSFPSEALVYENLLASCMGEREDNPPYPYENCGNFNGDWYDENLMVSPLDPNCASYFQYTGAGEILPTDALERKDAAETTIKQLGLHITKLNAMRRGAIDGVLTDIEQLSDEEIQLLADGYDKPDSDGQLTPFCAAIIYVLRRYFLPQP